MQRILTLSFHFAKVDVIANVFGSKKFPETILCPAFTLITTLEIKVIVNDFYLGNVLKPPSIIFVAHHPHQNRFQSEPQ